MSYSYSMPRLIFYIMKNNHRFMANESDKSKKTPQ